MDTRKSALDLTPDERDNFLKALLLLKSRLAGPGAAFSLYDQFAALHAAVMATRVPGAAAPVNVAHTDIGFLAWHREYLRRFELALQREVPGVTVPYWDWGAHARNITEVFANDFMGPVPVPLSNPDGTLRQQPQRIITGYFAFDAPDPAIRPAWWPPQATGWRVTEALQELQYPNTVPEPQRSIFQATLHRGQSPSLIMWPPDPRLLRDLTELHAAWPRSHHLWMFWLELEQGAAMRGTHNNGHTWMGGHMGGAASPNDPIFWLHHANVDRLWALWQDFHTKSSHSPDRIDDYVPNGEPNPWNGRAAPPGHYLDDMMWPWVGQTPGYVVDNQGMIDMGFTSGAIQGMLIDYSGEVPRRVLDVLDPGQVHGGYQYQPPLP